MPNRGEYEAALELLDALWARAQETTDPLVLNEAISKLHHVSHLMPRDAADRPAVLSNLGAALLQRADHTGEAAGIEEAITALRHAADTLPQDDPHRPAVLSNLGAALLQRADHTGEAAGIEEAITALRHAADTIPQDESSFSIIRSNLDEITAAFREKPARSGEVIEQIARFRRSILGENHPSTLASLNNLAVLHYNAGNYEEAHRLQLRSYSGFTKTLGRDHPNTLSSMLNFAAVLQAMGDLGAAEELQSYVYEVRRRLYGDDSPETARSATYLAATLAQLGYREAAQELTKRALQPEEEINEDAWLAVYGEDADNQFQDLESWLIRESAGGGQIKLVSRLASIPAGATINALGIKLLDSGLAAKFTTSLIEWIRQRKSDVQVMVTVSQRLRYEISTKLLRDMEVQEVDKIAQQLSTSMQDNAETHE